jgi:hypothetical protein
MNMKWLLCASLILVICFKAAASPNIKVMADESEGGRNKEEVEVSISKVHARINPDLEFALPGGNVYASLKDTFGDMKLGFSLQYAFFANSINGAVTLSWPSGNVVPAVRFYDGVAFENYIKPALIGDDLILTPTDKYISRKRGVELSVGFKLAQHLRLTNALLLNDVYKGDLSDSVIIDRGIDLIQHNNLTYSDIRRRSYGPLQSPSGTYFSSSIDTRFRSGYSLPLSIDNRNNLLIHTIINDTLFLTTDLSAGFPLKVWEKNPTEFYSLGGYNSVRGYLEDEMSAFRFLLLSEDFEYQFPRVEWEVKNILGTDLTFTGLRLLLLFDGLLTQERLSIESPLNWYLSVGGGLSLAVVEVEKRDWVIKLYLSQALQPNRMPVLYFTFSNYRFSTRLPTGG